MGEGAATKKGKTVKTGVVSEWILSHGHQAAALELLFADMRKASSVDLPMLIIAEQKVRALYGG